MLAMLNRVGSSRPAKRLSLEQCVSRSISSRHPVDFRTASTYDFQSTCAASNGQRKTFRSGRTDLEAVQGNCKDTERYLFSRLLRTKWCGIRPGIQGRGSRPLLQNRSFSAQSRNDALKGENELAEPKGSQNAQQGGARDLFEDFIEEEGIPEDEPLGPVLKGRGLHRAWRIQDLLTKRMAVELLMSYAVKHKPTDTGSNVVDGLVQDLRHIDQLLRNMKWTRRLDSFGIDHELEEAADSEEVRKFREEVDIRLIKLSKAYMQNGNIGNYIESTVQVILSSPHPPSQTSLAMMLDTFVFTYKADYADIVHGMIRKSRLPWSNQTIYAILSYYKSIQDGPNFLRFVSFLCGPTAGENGMKPWRWIKPQGQVPVPAPLDFDTPGILTRLISTSLGTGQAEYARSYLSVLLARGYGLSAQLIWGFMVDYNNKRDWESAHKLLEQICTGELPITPEATTPKGLQRIFMGALQVMGVCREHALQQAFLKLAVKHDIPPFEPNPYTNIKFHWAKLLASWDSLYRSQSGQPRQQDPKGLFKEIATLLGIQGDQPGFVYHNLRADGDLTPAFRSIWDTIKENIGLQPATVPLTQRPYPGGSKEPSRKFYDQSSPVEEPVSKITSHPHAGARNDENLSTTHLDPSNTSSEDNHTTHKASPTHTIDQTSSSHPTSSTIPEPVPTNKYTREEVHQRKEASPSWPPKDETASIKIRKVWWPKEGDDDAAAKLSTSSD